MGGIVKSIGKTIKKLGKSVGKFLKKYRTTIILAAAVWAGLGAFGASYSTGSMFGLESVKAGVGRIFGFSQAAKTGLGAAQAMAAGPGAELAKLSASSLAAGAAKSPNILSGIGKWLGGMESWQKFALTQGAMTMLGNVFDTSEEDALAEQRAAQYGGMGIPYGKATPENSQLNPSHRIVSYDQWTNPASTSSSARTGSSGQSSGARSPGVIGAPYMQQVSAAPMRSLDVSSPGIISGGRPGLLGSPARRRYA